MVARRASRLESRRAEDVRAASGRRKAGAGCAARGVHRSGGHLRCPRGLRAAPYYPPTSYYVPPPAPVEQGLNYRYFCPDTRQYYPEVKECASGWLTVLPGRGKPPS